MSILRTAALLSSLLLSCAGCSGDEGDGGGGGGCADAERPEENGYALSLGGGRVTVPATDLDDDFAEATFEAWVRRDGAGASTLAIAGRQDPMGSPPFAIWSPPGGDLAAGFGAASGSFAQSGVDAGIVAGEWTHVAVAWSDSALSFFVDGQVVINTSMVTGPPRPSLGDFVIGGGIGSIADPWEGAIDEVRVWSYAREAGEISASRFDMLTGDEDGLLLAWNFEEGGGSSVANLTLDDENDVVCHTGSISNGTFIDEAPF